jgi:hypothetical protein
MGEKTLAFVEKTYDYAQTNPNLIPPYVDMAAFGIDFNEAHGLWTIHNKSRQLEEGLGDTKMAAGSEAYQSALVVYHSVKMAAAQDIPGAKAVYEDLKTRFPQGGKRRAGGSQTEVPQPSPEA